MHFPRHYTQLVVMAKLCKIYLLNCLKSFQLKLSHGNCHYSTKELTKPQIHPLRAIKMVILTIPTNNCSPLQFWQIYNEQQISLPDLRTLHLLRCIDYVNKNKDNSPVSSQNPFFCGCCCFINSLCFSTTNQPAT